MSTSFVAAQTVYRCLIKSRPAASPAPVELLYFYLFTELVLSIYVYPTQKNIMIMINSVCVMLWTKREIDDQWYPGES